ncbi:hypothetical protein LOZ80_35060 [Paenibacillus sp. HWE-109]|uniref:hypothetical protein n=1 Tax=Paenibacillus sp. HWE-109 TaxID=1306526 RepID=UPI001EDE7165|nr:hypothetical protein [Paenibacillus sp. HWE-109]UKS26677.1 hypothetical protein LOZ80_35060 [Paenibacillus sp. HWE-109]
MTKNYALVYDQLNAYEREIVDELTRMEPPLTFQEALDLFNRYLPVLHQINDYYDSPTHFAHEFKKASDRGVSPESWIKRIDEIDGQDSDESAVEETKFKEAFVTGVRYGASLKRNLCDDPLVRGYLDDLKKLEVPKQTIQYFDTSIGKELLIPYTITELRTK